MVSRTFIIPTAKSKLIRTRDGTDVAARYFFYKLYDATGGQPVSVASPAWDGRVSGDHLPGG
jgi:hypothetical protein